MTKTAREKYKQLIQYLQSLEKVAVAFSGGVDSTFLLMAAKQALENDVLGVTINAPYIPNWEIEEAVEFVSQNGIQHKIIAVEIPEYIQNNPPDRCYLCKKHLFTMIAKEARELGILYVLDGTNKDDEGDYRPGMVALKELGVLSPLREVGLTKAEIREISKEMNLPTWSKPAYACLLTRIPFDTEIKPDILKRIEEGEKFLFGKGLEGARLRSHGDLARIEINREKFSLLENSEFRNELVTKLKQLGYNYICLDLEGYKMGSFNSSIDQNIT